jgi:hypothetical protein
MGVSQNGRPRLVEPGFDGGWQRSCESALVEASRSTIPYHCDKRQHQHGLAAEHHHQAHGD